MMTGAAELVSKEILALLIETPRRTGVELAEATGYSRQYVVNVLRVLAELELVQTPVRGVYSITQLGEYLVKQFAGSPHDSGETTDE